MKVWAGSYLKGKPLSKATGKSSGWQSHSEQVTGSFLTLKKILEKPNDLSLQFPAKRDSLINDWMKYAKENDVVDHHGYYDSAFIGKS